MFADAQRADDCPDARFERHDGAAVEVVPMVVGDDQAVDVWHVLRTVEVRAPERAVEEGEGRGAQENRVDQHPPSVGLYQVGGVAEPDRQGAVRSECAEVGADGLHGTVGTHSLFLSEQEFEHAAHAALAVGHQGTGFEVAELAVAVIRRVADPFEPLAPGQASEARPDGDCHGGDRRREDETCDHRFPSFSLN